jgi:hypothetical protein
MHAKRAGNHTSRVKYTTWNDGQKKVKYNNHAIFKALTVHLQELKKQTGPL